MGAAVQVDANMVRAFLHMRKGETLEEFKAPAKLTGAPVPVYCCLNCSTLYEDEDAEKPIHDDGRTAYVECPCKAIVLVNAYSLKFDFELACCTKCGAVFEKADKTSTSIRPGVAFATPCEHPEFKTLNAREAGIAYAEEDTKSGRPALKTSPSPVPVHIVRAVRIETEGE